MLRLAYTLSALALLAAPAAAAEKKPGQLRDFPFWSGPKTPHARAFVPGLQAALAITPEQAAKIEAACAETIDKPENRGKNAPGAAAAVDKLHETVAGILTPEQKKLIEKMNDTFAKVVGEVGEEFQPRFAAAKGNAEEAAKVRKECQEAIAEAFAKKLDTILTTDQKKAVEAAAAEQKKRDEEAKNKPKPNK